MRPAYLVLKVVLKFSLWVYYPRTRIINKPQKYFTRTIYASNHAASFMDPLVVASSQPPIVFFMTRSDVFKPWLKPILWASHMLPIYRSLDGEDTKGKNEKVFQKCFKILKYGRSLLVFSEGFTDDVFIRRLKPIKKGAIRIGFGACESLNWSKDIFVQAVGVNYSNPNKVGSDLVISNGEKIRLNDYKQAYIDNPNKVIADLTKKLEKMMQDQLTHVKNKNWAPVHENIMRITKKGMCPDDSDKNIPLLKRWEYSRNLANWLNTQDLDNNEKLIELKENLQRYFKKLDSNNISENLLTKKVSKSWSPVKDYLFFILLAPFTLLGLIHHLLPYKIVKNFVEKSFKRKVFWGSVKMSVGTLFSGIYNIILLLIINATVYDNPLFWWLYFFIVPTFTGVIAYNYFKRIRLHKAMKKITKQDTSKVAEEREELGRQIKAVVPVA